MRLRGSIFKNNNIFLRIVQSDPNQIPKPVKIVEPMSISELNSKVQRGGHIYRTFPEEYEPWKVNYYGHGLFIAMMIISYFGTIISLLPVLKKH